MIQSRLMQEIHTILSAQFPSFLLPLLEIPEPPKKIYYEGILPQKESSMKVLAVVGSRKHTRYGKDMTQKLLEGLRGYPIIIVSGLALGIDGIAHEKALEIGLTTVSVPGSGIAYKNLYPALHKNLAKKIIENNGALISEFEPELKAAQWTFPKRNRIMAGLCDAVLVIEAEEKSGTLITARLALDYNRTVLAVPGNIDSAPSKGTNWLIRQGATPITRSEDILDALNIKQREMSEQQELNLEDLSDDEKIIIELLREPKSKNTLIQESGLDASRALITLTSLELRDYIKEEMSLYKRII